MWCCGSTLRRNRCAATVRRSLLTSLQLCLWDLYGGVADERNIKAYHAQTEVSSLLPPSSLHRTNTPQFPAERKQPVAALAVLMFHGIKVALSAAAGLWPLTRACRSRSARPPSCRG